MLIIRSQSTGGANNAQISRQLCVSDLLSTLGTSHQRRSLRRQAPLRKNPRRPSSGCWVIRVWRASESFTRVPWPYWWLFVNDRLAKEKSLSQQFSLLPAYLSSKFVHARFLKPSPPTATTTTCGYIVHSKQNIIIVFVQFEPIHLVGLPPQRCRRHCIQFVRPKPLFTIIQCTLVAYQHITESVIKKVSSLCIQVHFCRCVRKKTNRFSRRSEFMIFIFAK